MDHLKYLERIQFKESINTSIEVLNKLQRQHLLTVPFENLDIHHGKKIELDKTYDKVVNKKRGGFCYELNGLFFELLKCLGFTVKLISARVYDRDKGFGPEFDHMAILTKIDKSEYLVDVGFGEFSFFALKIEPDIIQADPRGNFKIQKYNETSLLVSKQSDGSFIPQYIFTENQRKLGDFKEMCNFHQTSPDSHFTQKRLCSLPTEKGRITISGNTLQIKENGGIVETPLNNEEAFNKALLDYFGIKLESLTCSTNR